MKFLNPEVHGYLDYLYVAMLALAPLLLHLHGRERTLSFVLSLAVLGLSLCTRYPLGLWRKIPFTVHGAIEFTAAIFAIASPWLFRFSEHEVARNFFVGSGVVLVAVWLFTNYRATESTEDRLAQEREKAGVR